VRHTKEKGQTNPEVYERKQASNRESSRWYRLREESKKEGTGNTKGRRVPKRSSRQEEDTLERFTRRDTGNAKKPIGS